MKGTLAILLLTGSALTPDSEFPRFRQPGSLPPWLHAGEARPGVTAVPLAVATDTPAGTTAVGGPVDGQPPAAGAEAAARGPRARRARRAHAAGHIVARFDASVAEWRRPLLAAALGAAGHASAAFSDFSRVAVAAGDTPEALVARFRAAPEVLWAELDPLVYAASGEIEAAANFSDPLFSDQWHLERIRLALAADLNATGGSGVTVAVIDSGVAHGSGEGFPARRGIDLAGTRFAPGFDFVDGDALAYDEGTALDPDDPSSQRFGHGTFVTGLIAAGINNGVSGAGIAPAVSILPLRVIGRDGSGFLSDVAEAITFATGQGARVINLSLGGPDSSTPLAQAVAAAQAAGAIVVAAAGNEADLPDFSGDVSFPARLPGVLAVGATAFDNSRASYSNTGPGIDLMAPAGEDLAEVAPGILDGALAPSFLHDPASNQTLYASFWSTGTSWSAPQVSAAAALLIAAGVDEPDVVSLLLSLSARDLSTLGFDQETGEGLLDLRSAHEGVGFGF